LGKHPPAFGAIIIPSALDACTKPSIIRVPNIHTVSRCRPAPAVLCPPRPGSGRFAGRAAALTARQQQILDWIRGHLEATGMPPTRAEIAAGLGFSTASSAEDHLQALAKKGAVELTPGASRGLRLKDIPGMPVQGALPLVGRVAAGSPILPRERRGHYGSTAFRAARRLPAAGACQS
jgi:hypothetical protein